MKKFLFLTFLVILGLKFGIDYILSEKFQTYGDQTKAPWTCVANNVIASAYFLFDDPIDAQLYYNRTVKRCPKTSMAEKAAYGNAECFDRLRRDNESIGAYMQFMADYEKSDLVASAQRAISRIKSGHVF